MSKNSYDELVYKSKSFPFSTPFNMEALSFLYGLNPVNSKKCRVLELGSSFGGNILSQALYNPDNEYIGVDLSEEQIRKGNEIIESIGLKNIKLMQKNIMDIDEEFGKFDYIICHGVFSWVPDMVKEKILSILDNNLSENGIAYVSYNTYPGWKELQKIRDIMLYANKYYDTISLDEKVERSKYIINIIANQIKQYKELDQHKFLEKLNYALEKDNYYLAHEYLEEVNDPFYLHEFADMLDKHNLTYISDINLRLSFLSSHKSEVIENIKALSLDDNIIKEQCLDFVLDTQFRKSLICKKDKRGLINFTEQIPSSIIDKLYFYKLNLDDINDSKLKKKFKEVINSKPMFSISDLVSKNDDKTEMRGILLNLMVYNNVLFSLNDVERIEYKENKVYIPKVYTNYIAVCLKNIKYITMSNYYNDNINIFNSLDLALMEMLEKPRTKEELINKLDMIIEKNNFKLTKNISGKEVEVKSSDYIDEFIDKIEFMNFFVNV